MTSSSPDLDPIEEEAPKADAFRRVAVADPVPLPPGVRERWIVVRSAVLAGGRRIDATLTLLDGAGGVISAPAPLWPVRGGGETVLFATDAAETLRLAIVGADRVDAAEAELLIRPVGRLGALLRRLWLNRRAIPRLLATLLSGSRPFGERLRLFGIALGTAEKPERGYAEWHDMFESSTSSDLSDDGGDPPVGFLVFHDRSASDALRATVSSIEEQDPAVAWRLLGQPDDWVEAAAELAGDARSYLGLLQAGEVLPPHGASRARSALREAGYPSLAIGDEHAVDACGGVADPDWRPTPNLPLMLSGMLSRGLWLVRGDVVSRHCSSLDERGLRWAEVARLELWLRGREAGEDGGVRLPHTLSGRRSDREEAPAHVLGAVIAAHLGRSAVPLAPSDNAVPLRLRAIRRPEPRSVTVVVPTTLVAEHAERCISAVVRQTDYDRLRLIVALSGSAPPTAAERLIGDRLAAADGRIELRRYPSNGFNFAQTVNRAAFEGDGELLLLLNDDVVPIEPDWLSRMAAWFADHRVGIVGARLLYPDRTIQHAGVVIGMGGLCWHPFQNLREDAPDLPWRAILPQQLLAVTGACCLIRRELWDRLGGMDESYPSAFNDVDLCLRAAEIGSEIVLSDATLFHEESRTYGSHWEGRPSGTEARDVARMQRRWRAVLGDDPFYNPNLDLDPKRAWLPAWPPRRGGRPRLGAW